MKMMSLRVAVWTGVVVVGAQGAMICAGQDVPGNQGYAPAATARAAFRPFVIPFQVNPKSLVTYPPSPPITVHSTRIVARNGHFFRGNQRIKFWGINLTFATNFPSHAAARMLAQRLAQAGFNAVRLHHMDTLDWSRYAGIWDPHHPGRLDPQALDRLDYLLAQLAEHGIYADLNLHVGATYPWLGLPADPGGLGMDKMIDIFVPRIIAAEKDYARQLLGHINPYRGVSLANDPEIAIVEISNEDSLFMWNAAQQLKNMPQYYKGILDQRFDTWLVQRYGSTAALRKDWDRGAEPLGEQVLADTNFINAGQLNSPWRLEILPGNAADVNAITVRANGAAPTPAVRIRIRKADAIGWHLQFEQRGLTIHRGQYYTLQFRARAASRRTMGFGVWQDQSPWGDLGLADAVRLSPHWRTYVRGFRASGSDRHARLSFNVGASRSVVELADVSLRPGGEQGLLTTESLPVNVSFFSPETATPDRQMDVTRFLADTEKQHYDAFRQWLRDDMHCHAMITGTIVFGPLGLYGQSGMDFIDTHAYWQHPRFPGRAWDPSNWYIQQFAMVDHPAQATLWNLTAAHLVGKPLTVTEYNEPAPNDYQVECVPEIASFAAAQDWDGVWLFDYGDLTKGGKPAPFNFFSMGNNPSKWGFMAIGAAIFRGGAITPLQQAVTIPLAHGAAVLPSLAALQFRNGLSLMADLGDLAGVRWTDLLRDRAYVTLAGRHSRILPGPALAIAQGSARTTLIWHVQKHKSFYQATGAGALVWVGWANGAAPDDAAVRLQRPRFAAIAMAALDGSTFARSRKVLLAACGRCENSGMRFTADRRSVGRHWGHPPVLIEPVDASVELPAVMVGRGWSIKPLSAMGAAVGPRVRIGRRIVLHRSDATIWYLLTRE